MVQAETSPSRPTGSLTSPDVAWTVTQGDCLEVLATLPAASVDAVVTDPPYGIGFRGQAWDRPGRRRHEAWCAQWAAECLRLLKPGGHLASFGAPRTAHHLAYGIEEAGFELRDVVMWLFGQGFPKSRNLSGQWAGWGTTLKPAYEPIILARKRLDAATERNVATHRTGALHIDACRIVDGDGGEGRWPANLILGHSDDCVEGRCDPRCPVALLDAQRPAGSGRSAGAPLSRFFYCPKASRAERDAGCEQLPRRAIETFAIGAEAEAKARDERVGNPHPTVKPLALMRWLVRLVAPPGGLVLDPFCGSGTTGCAAALEGFRFLGIERDQEYARVARSRVEHWAPSGRGREEAPFAQEGAAP